MSQNKVQLQIEVEVVDGWWSPDDFEAALDAMSQTAHTYIAASSVSTSWEEIEES